VLIKYDESKPHRFDENQRISSGDPQYALDFAGLAEEVDQWPKLV
jgi:hypothetical protein